MKQVLAGLFGGILILSACGQVSTRDKPAGTETPVFVTQGATTTPSPIPTSTNTSIPNETPTASMTPLPTIPTFAPTFDASTIVTVTPAPKAECPNINSNVTNYQFNFGLYPTGDKYVDGSTIDSMMEYLNSGGQIENLIKILSEIKSKFAYEDITNDRTPDLILSSGSLFQSLEIIYCHNGQYIHFPNEGDSVGKLFGEKVQFNIQDLNRNNTQDILSISETPTGLIAKIWEWNGQSFMDLTPNDAFTVTITNVEIKDMNNDGISEMIEKGEPYSLSFPGQPLRVETNIYYWNGDFFSPSHSFGNPGYRFQAIQDGDSLTIQGNYDEAKNLYQKAIDSNELDWWSKERFEHNREAAINFTTPVVLAPDETEYPRLAAYAYYRIMLLHIVQGQETDAGTAYSTLQQKFGNNPYGHSYVEMATAFWEAYQSTHKMYDGCAAAIEYAAEHPEILVPLGSDYHGSQSHTYVPADVCPFR